jgi:hypothetical protein
MKKHATAAKARIFRMAWFPGKWGLKNWIVESWSNTSLFDQATPGSQVLLKIST